MLTVAGIVGAMAAVGPAVAQADNWEPGNTGYVEICKTFTAGPSGAPSYQGTFTYDISDSGTDTTVQVKALQGGPQVCTAPISVPSGTATITEELSPWFSVSSITASPGDPGTVTPSTQTAGVATVSVNPAPSQGDMSQTTTVDYTNAPVTGVIEVCKQADPNSPTLNGTYNFTVTSKQPGVNTWDSSTGAYDTPWSTTASATIVGGSGVGCSGPITVPAGTVETVEPGTTYVTGITATSNGSDEMTDQPDLSTGTSDELVNAGTTANQTIVTYTDALSTVKLCKEWSGTNTPNTVFPFTLSSSGTAGPTAVTGSVGLQAGDCQIVGSVRAGTQVNITEGVTPGTKLASISVNPTENSQGVSPIVPGSESLPNGTVSIIAGAGETDVTFTDEAAQPGTLKICLAPSGTPAGGQVPFTVGTQTINVNLSASTTQCTLVDSTQQYPFDGPVTITGGALPSGDDYTGTPTVNPTNVEVLEGPYPGTPTATSQPSLSASTASSATVLVSEGIVTEVTFTVDPPAAVPPGSGSGSTGSGSGSTGSGSGNSGSGSGSSAPVVSGGGSTPSVTPAPTPSVGGPVVTSVGGAAVITPATVGLSTKPAVNSSLAAKAKQLEKQLAGIRTQIRKLERQLGSRHLTVAVRRADRRKLAALLREQAKLNRSLHRL